MKRNILGFTVVLFILLIIILSFSKNFSRSYHHTFTKSTNLSNENIEGIYLNNEIDSEKILSKYGQVSNFSQDNSLYNYYFLRDGIEIATDKNSSKIIRFIVDDKNLKTEKGIQVGDSKERIVDVYGEKYYNRLEQSTNIIGYVDKEKDWSIEFWLDGDNVIIFRFDYNFMK